MISWTVTMGYLYKRHYATRSVAPEYVPESLFGTVKTVPRWRDIEEYMLILQTDQKSGRQTIVGAAATEIRFRSDPTTTATYLANFQLEGKLSPILPRATVKMSSSLDKNVNLTSFHGQADIGPIQLDATGEVADNLLYLKTSKGNSHSLTKRRLLGKISLAEALRPALSRQMEIETGNKMSAPVVDPITGQNRGILIIRIEEKESLIINGEQKEAFRVVSSIGDVDTTFWVDPEGKTLKRQLIGGLTMERTNRAQALEHAPSIGESLEIPKLDLTEFKDIPVTEDADSTPGEGSPALGVLDALLK